MRSALIGHTGFVGGTLRRSRAFDAYFNSKNSAEMCHQNFDLVICAGVSAVKWLANKEPEADRAAIGRLVDVLATVEAEEFILISTIDVYPDPERPDDEDLEIDPSASHAYGRHRLELERWVMEHFANARVVRLPALFGDGLKKNVIFDLLNGNLTSDINPASVFQWYPVRRLASDIELLRSRDLRLVNLFPEPVRTSDIRNAFFPGAVVGAPREPAPQYRLTTKYADLFGGHSRFLLDQLTVLGELAMFIAQERTRR
jgi:hypothetical protein